MALIVVDYAWALLMPPTPQFEITFDVSRIVSRIVSHSNLLNIVRVGRGITKYCEILSEIIEIFSGKARHTYAFSNT